MLIAHSSTEPITIELCNAQTRVRPRTDIIKSCVRGVLQTEGIHRAHISIAILDDRAIRELNRRHLEHDWSTDVITFTLSEDGDDRLVGEIVASAETAEREARSLGHDPHGELLLYVVHGLLHLCGFDDQSPEDAQAMRRREALHLSALGLSHIARLADSAAEARSAACPG